MAISTPGRTRGSSRTRPSAPVAAAGASAVRSSASTWLSHPLANVFLVAVPTLLLLALGAVMVWSASSVFAYFQFSDSWYFLKRQLAWLGVALVAGVVMSRVPTERLRVLGWLFFLGAAVLLILTFTPLGYCVKGNCNWINLAPGDTMLRLQPSEIAKIALVVWGAAIMAAKRTLLDQPKHLLFPFVPGALLLIVVVLLQHDLGTAIVLGVIMLGVLWCVGASWRVLGSMGLIVAAASGVLVAMNPSRMRRIWGFLDPAADPTGVNHQANQAQFGLASGGWWGVGLGQSRQKWGFLVEAHTDYIMAVIGEELGLIGTLSVIGLFVLLGWGGLRIAVGASTFYARVVAGGITVWIMFQAMVNMAVVFRLLPVLGVPLPFVSYGGSALLSNLIAVGVLLAIAREEPGAKKWLQRHRRTRQPRRRLSTVLPGNRPS